MGTQRTELIDQLSNHGWRIASTEENLEWWADEMWLVESEWSPVGRQAYITFLVDPQFDGVRKKGEHVWAVTASSSKPIDSLNTENAFTMSLSRGWQTHLPDLIAHLIALRYTISNPASYQ